MPTSRIPATHKAVISTGLRQPLTVQSVDTIPPSAGEVLIKVQWTASTPLDLHQNDGGLVFNYPGRLGDGAAGVVTALGEGVIDLKVGDKVFGFIWRSAKEKAHQEYATVPTYLLGKIPENITPQAAVTLPNNLVTTFHTLTTDLGLPLPYPLPKGYVPEKRDDPILIWGGSSSVGQFAVQILRYYGYRNILTSSSSKHFDMLRSLGATHTFDYRSSSCISSILSTYPTIPLFFDCIGSQSGSMEPLSKIAKKGSRVAVLLPVIIRDSTVDEAPQYGMDVDGAIKWENGVEVRGVRTHFYLDNEDFKNRLQSQIIPEMLEKGIVKPNAYRIVEGDTLLERAQGAMDALRRKEVSGERLVWRVSEQ
ncbi:chaperonin 10-like protein [Tricladium varicosporioides]|nr:chaperonin 10-like protein [Hymenoscyphus varicosporioides]